MTATTAAASSDAHTPCSPRPRVIFLGASNVTRCISTLIETTQIHIGGPFDLYAAYGHGRSLGLYTTVLGRGLCGLLDAGLWSALASSPAHEASFALLTDIGNDLVYEVPVPTICRWVDEILSRCQRVAQKIIVTELPLASIAELGPKRFRAMRQIIFPSCRLSLEEVRDRASALNEHVRRAAIACGATLIAPRGAWYGVDPIHIRRGVFASAWNHVLRSWNRTDASPPRLASGSLRRWLYIRGLSPANRAFFGYERRCRQPAGRLPDGTTIALY